MHIIMGCNFFYGGILSDVQLQEKIIDFVQSYFHAVDLNVIPYTKLRYDTIISKSSTSGYVKLRKNDYPFNFYGIIPNANSVAVFERGQFIFDRNMGGYLISFLKLPNIFNVSHADEVKKLNKKILLVKGGYHRPIRVNGSYGFALLLNIIRFRWWPGLKFIDDYETCKMVAHMIWKYGLVQEIKNEKLDFNTCYKLFDEKYKIHHPPKPSTSPSPPKPKLKLVNSDILSKTISDIDMGFGISQCLSRAGIKTIGDLTMCSEPALLKINNLDHRSLREIKESLEQLGLFLRSTS